VILETCAKVNLTLEMLHRRDDGYTELASVFQAIDLCDRIAFRPHDGLALKVVGAALPADASNLCWRAAELLAQRLGRRPDVAIELTKQVPCGAGLGGGSANAAGVLAALHTAWRGALTARRSCRPSARNSGPTSVLPDRRGGRGDWPRRAGETGAELPEPWRIVIVGPRESVSTAAVYRALAGFRAEAGRATADLARRLEQGRLDDWRALLVNDLEAPAAAVGEALGDDRRRLAELDLPACLLSGSGGSWFVPAEAHEAEAVAGRIRGAWPERAVWVTAPVAYGWRWLAEPERDLWRP